MWTNNTDPKCDSVTLAMETMTTKISLAFCIVLAVFPAFASSFCNKQKVIKFDADTEYCYKDFKDGFNLKIKVTLICPGGGDMDDVFLDGHSACGVGCGAVFDEVALAIAGQKKKKVVIEKNTKRIRPKDGIC